MIDLPSGQRLASGRSAWTFIAGRDAPPKGSAPAPGLTAPIPLRWLDGTRRDEPWFEGEPTVRESAGDATLAQTSDLLFGVLDHDEGPSIESSVTSTYARITELCSTRGFGHLLRLWNFFGAINEGEADGERYRRFCVGRARVLDRAPDGGFPAATAIGIPEPPSRLQIAFLASRHAGVAVENPRQTSAWEYPREFGPIAPGFSRAMLLPWLRDPLLLVSGTASVVGHASVHAETVMQLTEALRNVDAVAATASRRLGRPLLPGPGGAMRVYLRDAGEAPEVAAHLRQVLPPGLDWMLLEGDICRRELRVELELVQRSMPAENRP